MSEKLANAAPLGLLGFGLTTVLLNLVNIGLFPLDAMILAMGLVYGGIAQVIVGIMEYRRGNTFGTTAFTSYGLFWLSLVILIVLPKTAVFTGINTPTGTAMGAYFFMWGLFSFAMFFGTLKANRALQFVFISVTVLFFLLAARDLTGNAALLGNFKMDALAGYEGIICGSSAIYLGIAEVLNEVHKKTVMPIGAIAKIPSQD